MVVVEGLAVLGDAGLRFLALGLVRHRNVSNLPRKHENTKPKPEAFRALVISCPTDVSPYDARASRAASSTAVIMLSGSATPFPAMSNAVP
jgi:hypothetical protein